MSGMAPHGEDPPLVSVVIPTYNQSAFLGEAIDAALKQSYAPVEVVVIDNGSTDPTPAVVESYGSRIRSFRQENRGPSGARNRGVQEARGEFVVFCDGDDVLRSECVASRVALFAEFPAASLIVGAFDIVDARRSPLWREGLDSPRGEVSLEFMCSKMYGPTCGMAVRTSHFREVGGFDESLRIAEDSDLAMRLAAHGGALYDPEPLAEYRQAGASLSRNYRLLFDSYRRMARKNEGLLGSRSAYWNLVGPYLKTKFADGIFGKALKEGKARSLPTILLFLIARPTALPVFGYWVWRAIAKRLPWRKGNQPL